MIPNEIKTLVDFTLGDGHIHYYPEHGCRSASYKLEHSIKQRDYLWHKALILMDLGIEGIERIQDKGKYKTVSFVTRTHPCILTAYKWCYNKRRKAIDKALIRQLDDRSLAYFFMDDGSGPRTKKSTSKVNGVRYTYIYPEHKIERYTFSTYNCTLDELKLLQDWILSFGVTTNIKYDNRSKSCLGAFLSIDGVENKDKFRAIISPYIIPSMQYKIEGVHTFVGLDYIDVCRERLSEETPEKDEATVCGF